MKEIIDLLVQQPPVQFGIGATKGAGRGLYNLVDKMIVDNMLLGNYESWDKLGERLNPDPKQKSIMDTQRDKDMPFVSEMSHDVGEFLGGASFELGTAAAGRRLPPWNLLPAESATSYLTGSQDEKDRLIDASLTGMLGGAGLAGSHVLTQGAQALSNAYHFLNPKTSLDSFVKSELEQNSNYGGALKYLLGENNSYLKDKYPGVQFSTPQVANATSFSGGYDADLPLSQYAKTFGSRGGYEAIPVIPQKTQDQYVLDALKEYSGKKTAVQEDFPDFRPPEPGESIRSYAEQNRRAQVEPYYAIVDGDMTNYDTQIGKEFRKLRKERPSIKKAANQGKSIFKDMGGGSSTKDLLGSGTYISSIIQSLNDMENVARRQGKFGKSKGVRSAKNAFSDLLEDLSPEILKGNRRYYESSIPINQMDVADFLLNKTVPKGYRNNLSATPPGTLKMNAIRDFADNPDAIVQSVLQRPKAASEVLNPEFLDEMGKLNELAHIQEVTKSGLRSQGSPTAANLKQTEDLKKKVNASLTPLSPDVLVRMANQLARKHVSSQTAKYDERLGAALNDPQVALQILQTAPNLLLENKIATPSIIGAIMAAENNED